MDYAIGKIADVWNVVGEFQSDGLISSIKWLRSDQVYPAFDC